ncbi:hypothetical protein Mmc1_0885 [Magnetococcus marinus MC-1]|uniref:Hydrogenase maturation protease n=1 Tax=Magnetococcus marinus (strain ATCC BAA-1437 / JCM 17883 / MC-1) TaxID=156889 RepID=A0L611_MAGMM|nr:hydrogenase maturation protease [Magnetococcus marinus]ABK43404.1 hypothetical protein Mmc1_0885 [Magnetococcus marinus MC-1]
MLDRPNAAQFPPPWGVVGLGNPLMGDDGVGPWLVAQLQQHNPQQWLRDLGTDLLGIANHTPYPATLLVVDAVRSGTMAVGQWRAYGDGEVAGVGGMRSAHQLSAPVALCLEQRRAPQAWQGVTLYWLLLEVAEIRMGPGFSPAVAAGGMDLLAWLQRGFAQQGAGGC